MIAEGVTVGSEEVTDIEKGFKVKPGQRSHENLFSPRKQTTL